VGTPFLLVSLAFVNMPGLLTPLARRAKTIARVAGAVLVVLGVLLVTDLYTGAAGWLARFAPSI